MDDRTRLSRPADAACTETSPFKAAEPEPLLMRPFPVSAELPGYRAPSARRGLVAGVTVAALAYIPGVAVVLVVGQLGKLLGLSIDARDPLCPVPKEWEHTVTVPQAAVSLNSWSVFAAMTKSLRCRPLILCVHHVTVVLPHSVSTAG